MPPETTVNTIIVLRNDSTAAWEASSYHLLRGEVGIGYQTRELSNGVTKQIPIIKVGDGANTWKDLPSLFTPGTGIKLVENEFSIDTDTVATVASIENLSRIVTDNTLALLALKGDADVPGSILSLIAENSPKIATADLPGLVTSSENENKISVAADGTMRVNTLNVNKLVQNENEFMILNGGNANI